MSKTVLLKLADVCTVVPPGDIPPYSVYGYVVAADGTCYALQYQYYHGIVLAMLFPEILKAWKSERAIRYDIMDEGAHTLPPPVRPHDENNVFHYQRFELDNHDHFDAVRVCAGRMVGNTPISVNKKDGYACSEPQLEAMRAVFKALGLKARDKINTDFRDVTMVKCLDYLASKKSIYALR